MTIDTIRDVLGRIIAINKNLTEESLKNLLIASGWDDADVEQGLRIFRDYYGAGPTTTQPTPAPISRPEPLSAIQPMPPLDTLTEPTPTPKFSVFEINRNQSTESVNVPPPAPEPTPVITVPVQPTSVFAMHPAPAPEPVEIPEPVKVEPVVEYQDHTEGPHIPTPWGILLIDIVLFVVALGLLIYILVAR